MNVRRERTKDRSIWRVGVMALLVAGFVALSSLALAQEDGGDEEKITICHFPPGNAENNHTINVSVNAWEAHHENHGDTEGPCDSDGGIPAGEEDKITICHFPPGNQENAHTITVSVNAWEAHHENHGDTEGPCPPANGGNETDGNETDGNETDGNETDGNETDGGDGGGPAGGNETDGNETDGNETDGGDGADGGDGGGPAGGGDECRGPADIRATTSGENIHVSWDSVDNATSYNLYRSEAGDTMSIRMSTDGDTTSFLDEEVEVGTTYAYEVTAMIGDVETDACDRAEATAIPVFPGVIAGALATMLGVGAYALGRRRY